MSVVNLLTVISDRVAVVDFIPRLREKAPRSPPRSVR